MRVLLINPMPRGSLNPPHPTLPLGIACIASIACELDADVRILSGPDIEEALDKLLDSWHPECAGFQTFVNNTALCHAMADTIRGVAPDAFIVYGGVEASNNPETMLEHPPVDAVITGEGEYTFRELMQRLPDQPFTTPGLMYRNDRGNIHTNPGKALYENLDDLPPLPYSLFYGSGPVPVGHLLTHRGCPFHCSHCPLRFRAGVPIRSHSVERVVATVHKLHTAFGIRHIEFYDENFTMDPDHVRGISHGLAALPITYSCTARISQIDLDLCRDMAAGGCTSITFGLGTGVQRLQTILGTHEDLDHARDLITRLPEIGIEPLAVFSMGLPTETRAEFDATVQYALSLDGCRIRFEPAAPLPGSQLHKTAQSGGRFLIRGWDEYVRPNQIVYIPAGWTRWSFMIHLYRAKIRARLKHRFRKQSPSFH